ncbi:nucleotidyltransferase domain-containing protein [Niveispirillum sp. KHB5.9]|uniref:nucleotidyltransferase domain-containing protein n=1 Tax=Niveispirillum sp. KHB5.9 TaxID=3400269 RepID=UPI003A88C84A
MSYTNLLDEQTRTALTGRLGALRPDCISGQIGVSELKDIALNYVRREFQNVAMAFLFGSVARGTVGPLSDIDLYVIVSAGRVAEKRTLVFEGVPLECNLFDTNSFYELLVRPRQDRRQYPFIANALEHAALLTGDEGLFNRLQAEARSILELGPPPRDARLTENLRATATNRLMDLYAGKGPVQTLLGVVNLVELILVVSAGQARDWYLPGNWSLDRIAARTPQRMAAIEEASRQALNGDMTLLTRLAWQVLEELDGPVLQQTNSYNNSR